MEKKRRAKIEAIKKKTLAPKPPVAKRDDDFNADDHKFQAPKAELDGINETHAAFLDDRYTQRFIKKCEPDMDRFNERYLHLICHAHGIAQWMYDNRKTLAVGPHKLLEEILVVFEGQMPPGLVDRGRQYYTYKFMMYFMRAVRNEWAVERTENHHWEDYEDEDNLWCYFKHWYCDRWIGALLNQRHHKVKRAYMWTKGEADYSGHFEMHDAPTIPVLENALAGLHNFEVKWFRENAKTGDECNDLYTKPKAGKTEYLKKMGIASSHVLSSTQKASGAEAQHVMKTSTFNAKAKDEMKVKETPREPGVAPDNDEYNYSESDGDDDDFSVISKTPAGIPPQYQQPPPLEAVEEEKDDIAYPDLGNPIYDYYSAGKTATKANDSDMELASLAGGGSQDQGGDDSDKAVDKGGSQDQGADSDESAELIEPDQNWV